MCEIRFSKGTKEIVRGYDPFFKERSGLSQMYVGGVARADRRGSTCLRSASHGGRKFGLCGAK